jgi:hypothetical protein
MTALGNRATSPGTVYLVGGSTALLLGIREQTIDIDIKLEPEPGGVFEAIAELKNTLDINVELAAPDQFIPPLPGWESRSLPIKTVGTVDFKHYDLYAQALSKIERGYQLDISDARAFVSSGLVTPVELKRLAVAIRPLWIRYPAIDSKVFEVATDEFLKEYDVDES